MLHAIYLLYATSNCQITQLEVFDGQSRVMEIIGDEGFGDSGPFAGDHADHLELGLLTSKNVFKVGEPRRISIGVGLRISVETDNDVFGTFDLVAVGASLTTGSP